MSAARAWGRAGCLMGNESSWGSACILELELSRVDDCTTLNVQKCH